MKIGIDPDKLGGYCIMKDEQIVAYGNFELETIIVSGKQKEIIDYTNTLKKIKKIKGNATIEKPFVPAMHAGGEITWRNYQTAYLLFHNLGCTITEVRPQSWHKKLGITIPKEIDKKLRRQYIKDYCRDYVIKNYPEVDINIYSKKTGKKLTGVNQGIIDAICICKSN